MFSGPHVTINEMADRLSVSRDWIDYQIKSKKFPKPVIPRKRGSKWLLDEVQAYLREGQPDRDAWEHEHWSRR